jgi:putative heme-binding domain-containing protein
MSSSYTWGFDGWVYATHGFSNTSEVQGADGQAVTFNSGNTYRLRPDGSHLEQWTWGQVNPFGLALDPLGNLYSSDCHTRPLYQLLRGAYYPSFGKPDDGLGFGPEMVTHDHGSTGIAGVVYYDADHFPADYLGTIFVGNPVTSRVNHDKVEWHGSTPRGIEQPDFMSSDDPWFRPVDIELGPDGALYIADFYNKIIGHYEVPLTHPGRDRHRGRIWRIVYKGTGPEPAAPPAPPRADFTAATVDELAADLSHPNLTVRLRATHELALRPTDQAAPASLAAFNDPSSATRRAHAMWALERLGQAPDEVVTRAAADPDRLVRVHAQRLLANRSEWPEDHRSLVLNALDDPDAAVRRAAADALGRHPQPANIRPLLDLLKRTDPADTHLVHVARIALRDQLLPAPAWANLPQSLDPRDRELIADVAPGVPAPEAAAFLLDQITTNDLPDGQLARYLHHAARHGDETVTSALLAFARSNRPEQLPRQADLLSAYHKGLQERGAGLSDPAKEWATALTRSLLGSKDDPQVRRGIDLIGALRLNELGMLLSELVANREAPEAQRLAAMDAGVTLDAAGSIPGLSTVLASTEEAQKIRERSADALGQIDRPEAREALTTALPLVPANFQDTIANALAGTKGGAEALLAAVEAGKASARVLQSPPVKIRLGNAALENLDARLEALTASLPPADEAMQARINHRRDFIQAAMTDQRADAALGLALFQKTCATCHQIGGQGAKIGPQLDGVGARGLDRLLEDILDSNRNVDQAFRTTTLALTDGRVLSGLLLREEGDVLVLADSQGKEQRVPSAEVDERQVVPLSPMPADIADPLSDEEFSHLLAYLLSQRAAEAPR